jgi:DNA-binding IclR family transcriptional regulator
MPSARVAAAIGGIVKQDAGGSVKSAYRVLDLIEALGTWNSGLTHSELAEQLAIPKSSLSQLLRTMASRGYLTFDSDEKKYRLGKKIHAIAAATHELTGLKDVAQSVLERVTELTGESTFLNILEGHSARLVARVIGPQPLVTALSIGQTVPLYATAAGRAILAYLPQEMQAEYLAAVKIEPLTGRTIASKEELAAALDKIRKDRLSVSIDELVLGITGISVPILSARGEAIASLTASMPTVRYEESIKDKIGSVLLQHAELLQKRMAEDQRSWRPLT